RDRRNHEKPGLLAGRPPKGVGFGLGGEVVVSAVAARLRKPDGTYGWDGAYGTYWWVNRKAQMVAVIFVQTPAGRCNTTSTMQFRKRSSSSESRWTRWFRPGAHLQPRLWEASDLGCQAHIRRGCPARVVDDVRDLAVGADANRSEEHTSELQSLTNLVCRLLLEKK